MIEMVERMEFKLRNPDGMVPFWFWNAVMEESEIARQLKLAADGGLRGMCLHARLGNQVEYMSERWLELVRFACEAARREGLEIWLYDEEGFPSGSVGGRLPAQGAPYRQRALAFKKCHAREAVGAIRIFALDDLTMPADPERLAPDAMVLAFVPQDTEPYPYIDTLSRIPTEAFLDLTHRPYFKVLKEFFGNVIPFVYTDDVNHLLDEMHKPQLSWTPALEEVFKARWGYSLLDKLAMLVEDLPGCAKVRLAYRKTVRDLFLENFVSPMVEWCHAHQVRLLGHLSGDEGPFSKMLCRYTDAMAYYMTEDVPSIDDFGAGRADGRYLAEAVNDNQKSMLILCKTVASVAHQFKGGACSSELLTALGWGVPLHQILSQLNANLVLGMNMLTPHAYSYASQGVAKRDFPASFFFQQPWFKFHREFFSAAANSVRLLKRGEPETKLLIVHPFSSAAISAGADAITMTKCQQLRNGAFADPDMQYFSLAELLLKLEKMHIPNEFAHEETLGKAGTIENGRLRLGAAVFDEVLLPGLVNLDRRVLNLLRTFAAAGGKVSFTGRLPRWIDGEECEEDFSFAKQFAPEAAALPFTAENPEEILVQRRIADGKKEYFLVNFSGKVQHLRLTEPGYVFYNPDSDRAEGVEMTILHGHGAHILPGKAEQKAVRGGKWIRATLMWNIRPARGNVVMFDYASLPDGSAHYFGEFPKHEAGVKLATRFTLPAVHGKVILWSEIPALEVNGRAVTAFPLVHEANLALRGADVSELLHNGSNEITQSATGKRPEMFYLEGDFTVRLADNRFAVEAPAPLGFGNLARVMPFYWGEIRYTAKFSAPGGMGRITLAGVGVVKAYINGTPLPLAYTLPETREFALCDGENTLELVLANTAQNFFGNHREFALTPDYRGGEGRTSNAYRPPVGGGQRDSFAVAPFGLEMPVVERLE